YRVAASAATEKSSAPSRASPRRTPTTILAAPDDLARLKPFIMAVGRNTLQAWVDVRGTTVIVEAEGKKDAAADSEVFWQTLRAQVAKIERQP
ncbi:hypothetical protein P1N98_07865, partial [Tsukamurella tyrosinosolvens]|uniref:hypothetical protein n=1 Tax=Tsukamurella tyrosinosolvens TaxID=57704 RepID=UPI00247FB625